MALGMIPKPPLGASGQAGYDFGVFKTPAPNARIYNSMTTLVPGSVNFVIFCPVAICDFDPDLIVCVAEVEKSGDHHARYELYLRRFLGEQVLVGAQLRVDV